MRQDLKIELLPTLQKGKVTAEWIKNMKTYPTDGKKK